MGQEIVYCFKCQTRLLGSDFDKGLAFRVGAQVSCPECVRSLFAHLPPAEIDGEIARLKESQVPKRAGTSRIPVIRSPSPGTSTAMKTLPTGPASDKSKLYMALGGGGVALLLILGVLMSSNPKPAPVSVLENVAPPPVPPKAEPPPLPGLELPPGSFTELDRLIAGRMESDEYSTAARDLDKARSRRSEPAWALGIDERRARVEEKARAALPNFIDPALAAHHEGRADEVERLRSFIAAFPALAAEFDRRLASRPSPPAPVTPAPKPAPKPTSPPKPPASEAAGYKSAWDKAMALRDPAKVAASLEGTLKGLKTAEAKTEATQDLGLVKSAIPVRTDAATAVSLIAKDQKVKLDFSDSLLVVGSLEGTVLFIDAVRVRLATESGVLDLPVSELSDETLARLAAARSPADAKAAAVFCALRGLAEAAE